MHDSSSAESVKDLGHAEPFRENWDNNRSKKVIEPLKSAHPKPPTQRTQKVMSIISANSSSGQGQLLKDSTRSSSFHELKKTETLQQHLLNSRSVTSGITLQKAQQQKSTTPLNPQKAQQLKTAILQQQKPKQSSYRQLATQQPVVSSRPVSSGGAAAVSQK